MAWSIHLMPESVLHGITRFASPNQKYRGHNLSSAPKRGSQLTGGRAVGYAQKKDKTDLFVNMTTDAPLPGLVRGYTETFAGPRDRRSTGDRPKDPKSGKIAAQFRIEESKGEKEKRQRQRNT